MNSAPYNRELLNSVVNATVNTAEGFGYFTDTPDLRALAAAGLINVNDAMRSNDQIPAMATEQGKQAIMTEATETVQPQTAGKFALVTIPRPAPQKRTRAARKPVESKYDFDSLAAPDENGNVSALFVPATEKMPDPVKSLSSTVSQANRRYAKVIGLDKNGHRVYEYTRIFKVAPAPGGAHIFRDYDAEPGNNHDKVVQPLVEDGAAA